MSITYIAPGMPSGTFYGSTAPSDTTMLWIDTVTGLRFVYFNGTWVTDVIPAYNNGAGIALWKPTSTGLIVNFVSFEYSTNNFTLNFRDGTNNGANYSTLIDSITSDATHLDLVNLWRPIAPCALYFVETTGTKPFHMNYRLQRYV